MGAGSTLRRHGVGLPLAALLWRASGASATRSPLEFVGFWQFNIHAKLGAGGVLPCFQNHREPPEVGLQRRYAFRVLQSDRPNRVRKAISHRHLSSPVDLCALAANRFLIDR